MPARTLVRAKLLLTGTGGKGIAGGAVLVEDGRIKAAGARAAVERLAKKADVIDASRFTVMPGMINL
ncbi:MAG TPA: hypothetical protein VGX02_07515, partial [Candidatus Eremiobacteraceae bacterium]|nr:hypothetical protein [Candidatus Eremiobacteraceae bacterium]